jgi:hypothetical protein
MKKIFLTVSLCALFAAGAMAQGMKGGIKAGLNLSNITGDVEGTSMRTAFHVGGFLNFSFSDALSLQPELLYNSVGAKMSEFYEEEEVEVEVEGTQVLNYLSIPINLIYSFGNFNVQAGPQVSFLMSAKQKADFMGISLDVDNKEAFKSLDLGLNLGLGASFGKLHASARYFIGLTDVPDAEGDFSAKNSNIQLSLGYTLFGE